MICHCCRGPYLLDINRVGVSQPAFEEVTFVKEFDQLSVIYDTEDGKLYDGNQLQPLRSGPAIWRHGGTYNRDHWYR